MVHVQIADGLTHQEGQNLHRHRELTAELGGSYTEMAGSTPAQVLADITRARGAATVVVGHHRSRLGELAHGSVAWRLRRLLPETAIEEVRRDLTGHRLKDETIPTPSPPDRPADSAATSVEAGPRLCWRAGRHRCAGGWR